MEVINKNDNFYLYFSPHLFKADTIAVSRRVSGQVTIDIQSTTLIQDQTNYNLIMNDTRDGHDKVYPLYPQPSGITANIPLEDLYESVSTKRFFVLYKGDQRIIQQFNLNNASLSGANVVFDEIINSQRTKFKFYQRKDSSLGLKVVIPKLRRKITMVDDFTVSGYISSLTKFIGCQAYLYVEDRNSLKATKYYIDCSFRIEFDLSELIDIKSKDKTILDLFVVIMNNENEIVRKEKIKYKYADYKKDNYYDYKIAKDVDSNEHHFLITTTPFNNVKVETFAIPHDIHLPTDTSVKDDNVWLIGERYNTAQDNGIVLFNWLGENTNVEAYYVIEGDSPEYAKIKDNPNVLVFGSQEHYNIALKAKVLLDTHDFENILPYKPAKGFYHFENTYRVFLQHGVLGRKNVEYHKKYYELPFHLFIVSSEAEKRDVVMQELGYDENEVAITGLARFDNLIQIEKPKDILLMPTWRDWINTDEQFLESEYYAAYSSLINNTSLLNILDTYDVNLNFYPHYRAQSYFQRDVPVTNNRIKFILLGAFSVQDLLIKHALLITDFSSVSFDFTLMNKPVIYYHFDAKRFFRNGILRPIEETFIGKIANTEDELVHFIEDRLKSAFNNYDVDTSGILEYRDTANSERIYKVVSENLFEQATFHEVAVTID